MARAARTGVGQKDERGDGKETRQTRDGLSPRSSEPPIPTPWHDLSSEQRESAEEQGWPKEPGTNHRWLVDLHGRVIGRGLATEVLPDYFMRKKAAAE